MKILKKILYDIKTLQIIIINRKLALIYKINKVFSKN